MRGINISSVMLLIIMAWNLSILIFTRFLSSKDKKNSGVIALINLAANILLIAGLVYFSTVIGITGYNIRSDRIPKEFDGYKILQISDYHTGSFYGGPGRLIEKVKKEKPDIIVITGDLIDEDRVNFKQIGELIVQLVAVAPVYSVSGNHDVWYGDFEGLQKYLEQLGVNLLENGKEVLQRGNAGINLFGIGDPETWNDKNAEHLLQKEIGRLKPDKGYNILLFHRANMFDTVKGNGFQLVLSGHMHGGQLQIPFVGGLVSPHKNHRWLPKYTDGKWSADGTTMIVSRGLGNNAPVPRLLNPPEIVVVTLESKN